MVLLTVRLKPAECAGRSTCHVSAAACSGAAAHPANNELSSSVFRGDTGTDNPGLRTIVSVSWQFMAGSKHAMTSPETSTITYTTNTRD
jgi:hypothetical protein